MRMEGKARETDQVSRLTLDMNCMSLTKMLRGMSFGWIPRWPLGNSASRINFSRLRIKKKQLQHRCNNGGKGKGGMKREMECGKENRWRKEGRKREREMGRDSPDGSCVALPLYSDHVNPAQHHITPN